MREKKISIKKRTSISNIKNFLRKITGREFKNNKNIKNPPWKYLNEKKFNFFFVMYNNSIIGVIVIIDFKFTRHLSFLYILKEFRNYNLEPFYLQDYPKVIRPEKKARKKIKGNKC